MSILGFRKINSESSYNGRFNNLVIQICRRIVIMKGDVKSVKVCIIPSSGVARISRAGPNKISGKFTNKNQINKMNLQVCSIFKRQLL